MAANKKVVGEAYIDIKIDNSQVEKQINDFLKTLKSATDFKKIETELSGLMDKIVAELQKVGASADKIDRVRKAFDDSKVSAENLNKVLANFTTTINSMKFDGMTSQNKEVQKLTESFVKLQEQINKTQSTGATVRPTATAQTPTQTQAIQPSLFSIDKIKAASTAYDQVFKHMSQLTREEIKTINDSLKTADFAILNNKALHGSQQFNQTVRGLSKLSEEEMRNVKKAFDVLAAGDLKLLPPEIKNKYGDTIRGLTKLTKAEIDQIKEHFNTMGQASTRSINNFMNAVDRSVVYGLQRVGKQVYKSMIEWIGNLNKLQAKVVDVTNLLPEEMRASYNKLFESGLRDLAVNVGITDIQNLAEGLYNLQSASGDAKTAMQGLTVFAKTAKAGVSDVNTVVDFGTSAINAYADSYANAEKYMDVAFKTVEYGKVRIQDLLSSTKTLAAANQAGVGFDELMAVIGQATKDGIKITQTIAGFEGILKRLTTSKGIGLFKKIGIDVVNAEGKVNDFFGIFRQLSDKVKAGQVGQEFMSELFPLNRAKNLAQTLVGAFQKAGEDGKSAMETAMNKISFAGATGAMESAYGSMMQTSLEKGKLFEAQWNEFTFAVAENFKGIIGPIKAVLREIFKFMNANPILQSIVSNLLVVAATFGSLITTVLIATRAFNFFRETILGAKLLTNPYILAITALVAGFLALKTIVDSTKYSMDDLNISMQQTADKRRAIESNNQLLDTYENTKTKIIELKSEIDSLQNKQNRTGSENERLTYLNSELNKEFSTQEGLIRKLKQQYPELADKLGLASGATSDFTKKAREQNTEAIIESLRMDKVSLKNAGDLIGVQLQDALFAARNAVTETLIWREEDLKEFTAADFIKAYFESGGKLTTSKIMELTGLKDTDLASQAAHAAQQAIQSYGKSAVEEFNKIKDKINVDILSQTIDGQNWFAKKFKAWTNVADVDITGLGFLDVINKLNEMSPAFEQAGITAESVFNQILTSATESQTQLDYFGETFKTLDTTTQQALSNTATSFVNAQLAQGKFTESTLELAQITGVDLNKAFASNIEVLGMNKEAILLVLKTRLAQVESSIAAAETENQVQSKILENSYLSFLYTTEDKLKIDKDYNDKKVQNAVNTNEAIKKAEAGSSQEALSQANKLTSALSEIRKRDDSENKKQYLAYLNQQKGVIQESIRTVEALKKIEPMKGIGVDDDTVAESKDNIKQISKEEEKAAKKAAKESEKQHKSEERALKKQEKEKERLLKKEEREHTKLINKENKEREELQKDEEKRLEERIKLAEDIEKKQLDREIELGIKSKLEVDIKGIWDNASKMLQNEAFGSKEREMILKEAVDSSKFALWKQLQEVTKTLISIDDNIAELNEQFQFRTVKIFESFILNINKALTENIALKAGQIASGTGALEFNKLFENISFDITPEQLLQSNRSNIKKKAESIRSIGQLRDAFFKSASETLGSEYKALVDQAVTETGRQAASNQAVFTESILDASRRNDNQYLQSKIASLNQFYSDILSNKQLVQYVPDAVSDILKGDQAKLEAYRKLKGADIDIAEFSRNPEQAIKKLNKYIQDNAEMLFLLFKYGKAQPQSTKLQYNISNQFQDSINTLEDFQLKFLGAFNPSNAINAAESRALQQQQNENAEKVLEAKMKLFITDMNNFIYGRVDDIEKLDEFTQKILKAKKGDSTYAELFTKLKSELKGKQGKEFVDAAKQGIKSILDLEGDIANIELLRLTNNNEFLSKALYEAANSMDAATQENQIAIAKAFLASIDLEGVGFDLIAKLKYGLDQFIIGFQNEVISLTGDIEKAVASAAGISHERLISLLQNYDKRKQRFLDNETKQFDLILEAFEDQSAVDKGKVNKKVFRDKIDKLYERGEITEQNYPVIIAILDQYEEFIDLPEALEFKQLLSNLKQINIDSFTDKIAKENKDLEKRIKDATTIKLTKYGIAIDLVNGIEGIQNRITDSIDNINGLIQEVDKQLIATENVGDPAKMAQLKKQRDNLIKAKNEMQNATSEEVANMVNIVKNTISEIVGTIKGIVDIINEGLNEINPSELISKVGSSISTIASMFGPYGAIVGAVVSAITEIASFIVSIIPDEEKIRHEQTMAIIAEGGVDEINSRLEDANKLQLRANDTAKEQLAILKAEYELWKTKLPESVKGVENLTTEQKLFAASLKESTLPVKNQLTLLRDQGINVAGLLGGEIEKQATSKISTLIRNYEYLRSDANPNVTESEKIRFTKVLSDISWWRQQGISENEIFLYLKDANLAVNESFVTGLENRVDEIISASEESLKYQGVILAKSREEWTEQQTGLETDQQIELAKLREDGIDKESEQYKTVLARQKQDKINQLQAMYDSEIALHSELDNAKAAGILTDTEEKELLLQILKLKEEQIDAQDELNEATKEQTKEQDKVLRNLIKQRQELQRQRDQATNPQDIANIDARITAQNNLIMARMQQLGFSGETVSLQNKYTADFLNNMPRYENGGFVNSDQVAMLHEGEYVVNKNGVNNVSRGILENINKYKNDFKGVNINSIFAGILDKIKDFSYLNSVKNNNASMNNAINIVQNIRSTDPLSAGKESAYQTKLVMDNLAKYYGQPSIANLFKA